MLQLIKTKQQQLRGPWGQDVPSSSSTATPRGDLCLPCGTIARMHTAMLHCEYMYMHTAILHCGYMYMHTAMLHCEQQTDTESYRRVVGCDGR